MKDYSNSNPTFHDKITIVDTGTPDNGDSISLADRQNHDNTVVLKKSVDSLEKKAAELEKATSELEEKSGGLELGVSDDGCLTVTYDDGTEEV